MRLVEMLRFRKKLYGGVEIERLNPLTSKGELKNIEKPDDVKLSGFLFYLFFNHSNNRLASSSLNNCVPSFIVAADPQATPQRITSFRLLFEIKPKPCRPPYYRQHQQYFFLATLGAGTNSYESLVTRTAPCGPRETTNFGTAFSDDLFCGFVYFFQFHSTQLVLLVLQHWV
jgi:hypothetical protein